LVKDSKAQDSVLVAINSPVRAKINLPSKSRVSCRLRALCALWNFAVDEGFGDTERVDIAIELVRTLPEIGG
jgi:hypothetical protein